MVATLFIFCGLTVGMVGCSNDSSAKITPDEKEVKAKDEAKVNEAAKLAAAKELAAKEAAAKEVAAKELAEKELAAKILAAKELAEKEPAKTPDVEPEVKKPAPKEIAKESEIKPIQPEVVLKEKEPETKSLPTVSEPKKKEKGTPTEPAEVGGKSFEYWIGKLKSTDPCEREDAIKAVTMFGPNKAYSAVPSILAELKKHTSDTPIDLSVRVQGVAALATVFQHAWSSKKDGPDPKHLKEAVPILKRYMLTDDQAIVRVRALQAIPWLGPIAVGEIEDVIKVTAYRGTWEVRKEAIRTLVILAQPDGKGAPSNSRAIKHLVTGGVGGIGGMNDPAYQVRVTAIQGIAALCKGTGSIPQELYTKGLVDISPDVRLASMQALVTLKDDLNDKDTKPGALKALALRAASEKTPGSEKLPTLRLWTHASILAIRGKLEGKVEDPHFDALLGGLSDPELSIKVTSLTLIGSFGDKTPRRALGPIIKLVEEKDASLAAAALVATVQLRQFAPVLGKLKDKAPEVRLNALQLISQAGSAARDECSKPVRTAVDEAIKHAANEMLCKDIKDQEVTLGETAIATLFFIHSFESESFLRAIADNPKGNANLKDAARDALEDFKILKKELEKKKN
jgi:hypothetical protein